MKKEEVKIDIKKTVEEFFEKYADILEREHNITIVKECEEDWNENWGFSLLFTGKIQVLTSI